jgi:hypothetical protein
MRGVTSAISSPGDSTWTLQAVKMKAKRCQNLDYWYVKHLAGPYERVGGANSGSEPQYAGLEPG